MKAVLLAAVLMLAVAVPCAGAGDLRHPVLDTLAKKGEWRLLEPVRTFGPDNLYEEIDGEAELYLPYGMERLTVAVLGRKGKPASEVRLELFRMASPRDAYGIWSQYRFPDQEVLRIPPSEVIVSDMSADFFRGDTFVRIRSKSGDGSRDDGIGIASEVVALLPGSGSPPEEAKVLEKLPGSISGSIHYQKRAMLGYECLAPGFEAGFSTATSSGRYLFLPPAAKDGSGRTSRLARELPGYREVNASLSVARIPSGNVWMIPEGRCILAVAGKISREEAERLLSTFERGLPGICRPVP